MSNKFYFFNLEQQQQDKECFSNYNIYSKRDSCHIWENKVYSEELSTNLSEIEEIRSKTNKS